MIQVFNKCTEPNHRTAIRRNLSTKSMESDMPPVILDGYRRNKRNRYGTIEGTGC